MLTEGTLLGGRYRIKQHIGLGGMAEVYEAIDLHTGRAVAAKVMNAEFSKDREFLPRFMQEIETTRRLVNVNVVSIFDFGHDQDTYYMIMEYVAGTHLKKVVLLKGKGLGVRESLAIVIQACQGLAHAHKNGIIHRDITTRISK